MKLIKVDDNGEVTVFNDIVAFDFLTKDDLQNRAADYGETLTDEELEAFHRKADKLERFPDYEDVAWLIKDILEERNERT